MLACTKKLWVQPPNLHKARCAGTCLQSHHWVNWRREDQQLEFEASLGNIDFVFKKKIKELFIILIRNEESSHSIPSAPTHSVQLWLCDKQNLAMSKKPSRLRLTAGDGRGSGSLLQE